MNASPCPNQIPPTPPLRFGKVALTGEIDALREAMNREIIDLMKSLPPSLHAEAVSFFVNALRVPLVPAFDFFQKYFPPAWSIIHWIEQPRHRRSALSPSDRRNATTAHAMALFLHLLDDHLNDGQLQTTHFSLLLRSQAWLRMNDALLTLSSRAGDDGTAMRRMIDCYYSSIGRSPSTGTLDAYCEQFRRQMATGMIVPFLMAAILFGDEGFTDALLEGYGAFGIAWRLLDDMCDIVPDLRNGTHSAVYWCLREEMRRVWDRMTDEQDAKCGIVGAAIQTEGVWDRLKKRIVNELDSSASVMAKLHMNGLAAELGCLAAPLR